MARFTGGFAVVKPGQSQWLSTGDSSPTLSVVIPAFGRRESLSRAMYSVANQTRFPDEIVVVDDGSPEPLTVEFPCPQVRTRLIRFPENRGVAAARNAGVEAASGEVIAFLDSDDAWQPWNLDYHSRAYSEKSAAAAFAYALSVAGGCGVRNAAPPVADDLAIAVSEKTFVHCMSCFSVLKRAYLATGGMRSEFEPCEDLDFFIRLFSAYKAVEIPLVLVHRGIHAENLTSDIAGWARGLTALAGEAIADIRLVAAHPSIAHGVARRLLERCISRRVSFRVRVSLFHAFLKALPLYARARGWRILKRQRRRHLGICMHMRTQHSRDFVVVNLDSQAADYKQLPFCSSMAECLGMVLRDCGVYVLPIPLSCRPKDDHRAVISICAAAAGLSGVPMTVPSLTTVRNLLSESRCLITNNIRMVQLATEGDGRCPVLFLKYSTDPLPWSERGVTVLPVTGECVDTSRMAGELSFAIDAVLDRELGGE